MERRMFEFSGRADWYGIHYSLSMQRSRQLRFGPDCSVQFASRNPRPLVGDDLIDCFVQGSARLPPDHALELLNIGDAPPHIFKARFIGLVIRDSHDLRSAACSFAYALGKLPDRDLLIGADVKNFANRAGRRRKADDGLHHIVDVAKAALLFTVTINLNRLTEQSPLHETRHDHAIVSPLTRAHRIKHPEDDDWQIGGAMIGQRQKLVQFFGSGVAPTALGCGSERSVVFLAKRYFLVLAIYF